MRGGSSMAPGLAFLSMIMKAAASCDKDGMCDVAITLGDLHHSAPPLTSWYRPGICFFLLIAILWSCMMCAAGWLCRTRVFKMQAQGLRKPTSHDESCQVDLESLSLFPGQAKIFVTQHGQCFHSSGCHTLKGELKMYRCCQWCLERAKETKGKKVF